ncbi:MAG TPA: hypothetical protein VIH86_02825 [Puia sp.]
MMFIKAKYFVSFFSIAFLFVIKSTAENNFNRFCLISKTDPVKHDSSAPQNAMVNSNRFILKFSDSLLPALDIDYRNEKYLSELSDVETEYNKSKNNTKALIHLLRMMNVKKMFKDKNNHGRLLIDLAKVSARLKLYPLAMESYFESESYNDENSSATKEFVIDEQRILSDLDTTINRHDESVSPESKPVNVFNILESFDDNKPAIGYALIVHVKQPTSGKRKAFTGINNVGHMFITLIKYNEDNTVVTRSFGFYPDKINKNNTFSATPIDPSALSVFKDDSLHNWDEAIGKFISQKRFKKILKLLVRYDQKLYNLNQNNCTDFGLNIAGIGGINIFDTKGKWLLGSGNNPATAGQSILDNKLFNADTESKEGLFICTSKSLEKN